MRPQVPLTYMYLCISKLSIKATHHKHKTLQLRCITRLKQGLTGSFVIERSTRARPTSASSSISGYARKLPSGIAGAGQGKGYVRSSKGVLTAGDETRPVSLSADQPLTSPHPCLERFALFFRAKTVEKERRS